MPEMTINLQGDNCWPDLQDKGFITADKNKPIQLATLPAGMVSGKPSVSIRMDLPDGTTVIGETSVALFQMAAAAMKGRFGDQT